MVDYRGGSFPDIGQEIGPDNWVIRYIREEANFLVPIKDLPGNVELARSVFMPSDSDGACSVDWRDALVADGAAHSRIAHQDQPEKFRYSLMIKVEVLNNHGLRVIYTPIEGGPNANRYHCSIIGYPGKENKGRDKKINKNKAKEIIDGKQFIWIAGPPRNLHP